MRLSTTSTSKTQRKVNYFVQCLMGTLDGGSVVEQELFLGQNMKFFCNTHFTFTRYSATFHSLKDAPFNGKLLARIFEGPYMFR